MAKEITPTGTPRPLPILPSQSVTDKPKKVPVPRKENESDDEKKPDDDPIHIDEYI